MQKSRGVTILGAGSFGTAMAVVLSSAGRQVKLWDYKPDKLEQLRDTRTNPHYLPGVPISESVEFEPNLSSAVHGQQIIVLALPSRSLNEVLPIVSDYAGLIVSLVKGLDIKTGQTVSALIKSHCPMAKLAALGGPTFADEIGRFIPSAMVVGSEDLNSAEEVQNLFNTPFLRIYTSQDIHGVELGGALKNIIAIAAGVSDGLGFGDNSKAALATRAIIEVQKLGVLLGGQKETFLGLSGLGDLMATCFSNHSRNRRYGHLLGEGISVDQIPLQMGVLVEGVPTCKAAFHLAKKHGLDTPIINQIYEMLYEQKSPRQAIADLISRKPKPEDTLEKTNTKF